MPPTLGQRNLPSQQVQFVDDRGVLTKFGIDYLNTLFGVGSTTGAREVLSADRTYYVRADGSNSNTGLVNSAGFAFLTPNYALEVVAKRIDGAGFNVTIQIGDGVYDQTGYIFKESVGVGSIIVQGNVGDHNAVELKTTTSNFLYQLQNPISSLIRFKHLKVTTTNCTAGAFGNYQGNSLVFDGVNWNNTGAGNIGAQCTSCSTINYQNAFTYTDTGSGFLFLGGVGDNAFVSVEPSVTLTVVGAPAMTCFFQIYRGGVVSLERATVVNGAGATGLSYAISVGGMLDYNALTGALPGNSTFKDSSGVVRNEAGVII